jgi:hypothetical protein
MQGIEKKSGITRWINEFQHKGEGVADTSRLGGHWHSVMLLMADNEVPLRTHIETCTEREKSSKEREENPN